LTKLQPKVDLDQTIFSLWTTDRGMTFYLSAMMITEEYKLYLVKKNGAISGAADIQDYLSV